MPYPKSLNIALILLLLTQQVVAHDTPKAGVIRKVSFMENAGQWDNKAHFRATIPGGSVYAEKQALHYIFRNSEDVADAMTDDFIQKYGLLLSGGMEQELYEIFHTDHRSRLLAIDSQIPIVTAVTQERLNEFLLRTLSTATQ